MDAHGLDIIVGEVALCRFPILSFENKQIEASHDPSHLPCWWSDNSGEYKKSQPVKKELFSSIKEIGTFENTNFVDPKLQMVNFANR